MSVDLEALFDAVKACDLRSVLERRGYKFKSDGFFVENPLREERTSSIHVHGRSRWKDFGGESGDLLDFLQKAEGLGEADARRVAAELLGVASRTRGGASQNMNTAKTTSAPATSNGQTTTSRPTDLRSVIDAAARALHESDTPEAKAARVYLATRGLDPRGRAVQRGLVGVIDKTIDLPASMNRSTFHGRLVFGYASGDGVPFLNARAAGTVASEEKFRKPAGLQQLVPYNAASLDQSRYAIIVEGEIDALAVLEALGEDTPVVATGGGGLKADHVPLFQHLAAVLLLFDRDDRGFEFEVQARDRLKAAGITATALALPDGVKDAAEALEQLGVDALRAHLQPLVEAATRDGDHGYLRTLFLEELDRRHERPWSAYSTGLKPLDDLLDGGFHEGLHVLAGITGQGKTSLSLRIALLNAEAGRDVIYATFEQSRHELWARLAAAATAIPYSALKRGTYLEASGDRVPAAYLLQKHVHWKRLLDASEHLHVLEAGDAFSRIEASSSVEEMQALAKRLKRDTGVPPLVIVDYIQRMPGEKGIREVRERVDYASGLLQVAIAREVGSPVLALSSVNRASYALQAKATREQRLASLKESGGVEFTAYSVLTLTGYKHGEEPAGHVPGPSDSWRPVEVAVVKNREGREGEFVARWKPVGDHWSVS